MLIVGSLQTSGVGLRCRFVKKVVVIGATSAVAQSIAKIHAARRDALLLVARNEQRLQAIKDDLLVHGADSCSLYVLDLCNTEEHDTLWQEIYKDCGKLDVAYIAHGVLPDQKECEESYEKALQSLEVNALSVISLLTGLASRMEADRSGKIVAISSVAGDRGRASNYVYGTAKAAVSTFLQGLRNRLQKSGVTVLTVKPGFIDTPMTKDFEKGMLWAKPDKVAADIVNATDRNKNVIYTPSFWFLIMLIIKLIPERIFKRLSI